MITLNALLDICEKNKIHITPLRKNILKCLFTSPYPMGAYEILDILNKNSKNKSYTIMSIYRILNFFLNEKLIHKIDSDSKYSLCCHPYSGKICQLFICKICSKKIESHNVILSNTIKEISENLNFKVTSDKTEIIGICQSCLK